jgi:hypothetical protein
MAGGTVSTNVEGDIDFFDLAPFITERTLRAAGGRLRDPRVKGLLDAGMQLLLDRIDSGIGSPFRFSSADDVCAEALYHPPFRSEPMDDVDGLARAVPFRGPDERAALDSARFAFKAIWSRLEHYHADLAMYTLTMPAWFAGGEIAGTALQRLVDRTGSVDTVLEHIACENLTLFEDSLFRVQLVMQAMAPGEDLIRDALDRMYGNIDRTWTLVYQGFLDHFGARLRPDVSVLDITHILTAVTEGTGLRRLVQFDDKSIFDAVQKRSILGKATACVFAASISRDGDGETLAEFFRGALPA